MSELVSVMIVAHNGMPYLCEAVDSVIAQTYTPIELVLVDDGSDDGTPAYAESLRDQVVYMRQDRAGIAAARNTACSIATGGYLTFLDADDLMRPAALATLAHVLADHADVDAVFAHVDEFLSPELDDDTRRRLRPPGAGLPGRLPTTMLCRREAFLRIGGFDPSLRRGVTLDWTARALESALPTMMIDDVLYDRRLHKRNNGLVERASTTDYLRVVKASLDRRRERSGSTGGAPGQLQSVPPSREQ